MIVTVVRPMHFNEWDDEGNNERIRKQNTIQNWGNGERKRRGHRESLVTRRLRWCWYEKQQLYQLLPDVGTDDAIIPHILIAIDNYMNA